jgi:hypothetical protein
MHAEYRLPTLDCNNIRGGVSISTNTGIYNGVSMTCTVDLGGYKYMHVELCNHMLWGLRVLPLLRPNIFGRCSKQTVLSPSVQEEEVHFYAQPSCCWRAPISKICKCLGEENNLDIPLSVLSSVQSDILCRRSTHTTFSLCLRGGGPLLGSVRAPTMKGRLLLSSKRRPRCPAAGGGEGGRKEGG